MPMLHAVVLDTSALLSGQAGELLAREPGGAFYAPESILQEFRRPGRDRRALDYLLEAGLRLMSPSVESTRRAEEAAARTGDDRKLSDVDLDVISIAIDVKGTIRTDDYSIQNVASVLLIPFQGIAQKGIQEVWEWVHRCRGCGRIYKENTKECAVCGSEVRAVKARPGQRSPA
ncbi:MAG: NOB1 family endonuclease [Thermoplasmatota archaeon]